MYEYRAVVVRWIDGDTVICHVDMGFHDWKHDQRFRLNGIDAPDKQPAKEAARAYVAGRWPPGTELTIRTIRDKNGSEETTFERWMADLWDRDGAYGDTISDLLVDAGIAKKWDGKGPHPA